MVTWIGRDGDVDREGCYAVQERRLCSMLTVMLGGDLDVATWF